MLGSTSAAAEPAQVQVEARRLSANPDAPTMALFWRKELHGKVGASLPLIGGPRGFSVELPAFVELHNRTSSFVPYQYWRGRVSLEATHRAALDERSALGLSVLAEHESDHVSGPPGHFLNKNGVAFRSDLTWLFGSSALTVSSIPRLHLRTCTLVARVCSDAGGRGGSAGFEQTIEVVFDGGWAPREAGNLRYFVAAAASWVLPHRLVAEERRAVLELGLSSRRRERGLLQLYVTGLAGNELGYLRATTGNQLGLGVRWAFL
ncbi:MAG: hypothetical protein KF782_32590 [Labilithrix sp.]|nr:hypothetical protein [Labilithrix sp.]